MRAKETFPMKEKFPLIGEADSSKILREFFQEKGETVPEFQRIGYSNIYVPSTIDDEYDVVAGGDYFHEYVIDGNIEEKIWVRASDGAVFDQKRLDWVMKKNQKHEEHPKRIWTDDEEYEP